MKERIPGYQEISMEISFRVFRVRHATAVFPKLLTIMKRQIKTCNKNGYITTMDVNAVNDTRKAMKHYLDTIVNEMRLAEEAFSRFMRVPEDAEKEQIQGMEAMIRRLYHEAVLTPKNQ